MSFRQDSRPLREREPQTRMGSRDALWWDPVRSARCEVDHGSILAVSRTQFAVPESCDGSLARVEAVE
jgi:hypothetical protein